MDQIKIAIVGAGAAGMFCAIHCAELGAEVTLFERNEKLVASWVLPAKVAVT